MVRKANDKVQLERFLVKVLNVDNIVDIGLVLYLRKCVGDRHPEGERADEEAGAEVEGDGPHGRALAPPPHRHRRLGRHPNRRRSCRAAAAHHRRGPLRLHHGAHLALPLLPPPMVYSSRAAGLDSTGFACGIASTPPSPPSRTRGAV